MMDYTPAEIAALRHRAKLTQEQFAHALGMTTGTVNRWEQGVREPSPLARRALAEFAARAGNGAAK